MSGGCRRTESIARVLQWIIGDGEVTVDGAVGGAWHGEESSSAKGNSGEELQCDAWEVSASRRWPGPGLSGGRCCAAPAVRETEREAGCGRQLDLNVISKSSGTLL